MQLPHRQRSRLPHSGSAVHARGVAPGEPGLYFVGLHFLHALSSTMIHGVGRDAAHVTRTIAARRARAERREGNLAPLSAPAYRPTT